MSINIARIPVMEKLVPSLSEETVTPVIQHIQKLEEGARLDWPQLKTLMNWPAPKTEEEEVLQSTRHGLLVQTINRHAGKMGNGDRFQLRVVRGEGVEVLRGDSLLNYRRLFEVSKIKNATITAVSRLAAELDNHQDNMTEVGRYSSLRTLSVFDKMMERAVADLDDLLKDLEFFKKNWK